MTGAVRPLTIGVTGTAIADSIETTDGVRTEDMGGIYYAVHALSALLPAGMVTVPILAVGADMMERVRADFGALYGVEARGLIEVPQLNNRVRLIYTDTSHRGERLTGGVRPLTFGELAPWTDQLDVWLWNFISGMETDLATFGRVAAVFKGRIYLDLHSLCLDPPGAGPRRSCAPDRWEEWVAPATWLQLNAVEAGLLWRGEAVRLEPAEEAALCARIHGLGPRGVLVTHGADGAAWYPSWDPAGETAVCQGAAVVGRAVDPTGCGDVFGAAWLAFHEGLGYPPEVALEAAVRAAGLAAGVRGTATLSVTLAREERP
ncbi:MAG: carbohydrate kinase family protein [Gemmatimonadota bacterium]